PSRLPGCLTASNRRGEWWTERGGLNGASVASSQVCSCEVNCDQGGKRKREHRFKGPRPVSSSRGDQPHAERRNRAVEESGPCGVGHSTGQDRWRLETFSRP